MLDRNAITDTARTLLKEFERDDRKVRLIGVKVSNLQRFETSPQPIDKYLQ